MAQDASQRYLKDAKNRRGLLIAERDRLFRKLNVAFDTGAALKITGLPFHGIDKAEIAQHGGANLRGDSSRRLDGAISQVLHRRHSLAQLQDGVRFRYRRK